MGGLQELTFTLGKSYVLYRPISQSSFLRPWSLGQVQDWLGILLPGASRFWFTANWSYTSASLGAHRSNLPTPEGMRQFVAHPSEAGTTCSHDGSGPLVSGTGLRGSLGSWLRASGACGSLS